MRNRWRTAVGLLCASLLLGTTACQGAGPSPSASSSSVPGPSASHVPASGVGVQLVAAPRDIPKASIDEAAIDAIRIAHERFAARSASQVLSAAKGNGCYSPLSLYLALGLAVAGARGTTQNAMLDAMYAPEAADADARHEAFTSQLAALMLASTQGEGPTVDIANSAWMRAGVPFEQAYIDVISGELQASLYTADFTAQTAQAMSDWARESTNGLVSPRYETPEDLTVLYLLNAVYFKGAWKDEFAVERTKPDAFTRADGSIVECDFMNRNAKALMGLVGDGFQRVRVPLEGGGYMAFLLPDEGRGVEEWLTDPAKLEAALWAEDDGAHEVVLQVPKFAFDSSYKLNDALAALGMSEAFDDDMADFSGMSTTVKLFISNVRQDTRVEIDEKGVEAAAVTRVEMSASGAYVPQDLIEMRLTRPFLYQIVSKENVTLFVGVVDDPTAG